MPILWRYLLRSYLKIFSICICSFVSLLLVMRTQEIARLVALHCELALVLQFIACQIPYILPLAIPISALIASFLLIQSLSRSGEITALQVAGLRLKAIYCPLFFLAGVLSTFNFLIVTELTPYSRLHSRELLYKVKTVNPLILMKKSKFLRLDNSYAEMNMGETGREAREVIFATANRSQGRISLMLAKELEIKEHLLEGKQVALISTIEPDDPSHFDHLLIENQEIMSISAEALTTLMQKKEKKVGIEHLSFQSSWSAAFFSPALGKKMVKRAQYTLIRSLFFPLVTFCFTFLGLSFGLEVGREKNKRGLFYLLALSSLSLLFFLAGKSFELSPIKAALCFFIPLPMILLLSLLYQKKMGGGGRS